MKTKVKTKNDFDAVAFMRKERDRISKETEGMNHDRLSKYFKQRKIKYGKPDDD